MNMDVIKDQICDVCHKMWQLGWVAANDGNVSAKLEDGTILATPTGMSKSFITPDKLIHIDAKGNVLEAAPGLRPSSEIKMHLRCYEKREDVFSVIHAHPPGATGFAVAHKAMDMYNMIEDVSVIGSVPLTPYGTPSTTEVPDAIEPYLEEHDVMLLENHGAYSVVESNQMGIMQHDPFSWQVTDGAFHTLEEISSGAKYMNQTLNSWITGMSIDERIRLVDVLYGLLTAGNIENVFDAGDIQKNIGAIYNAAVHLDPETRSFVLQIIRQLAGFALHNIPHPNVPENLNILPGNKTQN